MKIELATEMGLCFGVRRAIDIVLRAAREAGSLETLGPLVHNRRIVADLEAQGVTVVPALEVLKGRRAAITSHGAGPQTFAELERRGLAVVDATCPFVRSAQRAAQRLAQGGYAVIVFGDALHPEVQGVLGWAQGRGLAVTDPAQLKNPLPRRLGVLAQTTQNEGDFTRFAQGMLERALAGSLEVRLYNTICDSTRRRQAAAQELARRVDLMVVVGGRSSANTRRLADVCARAGAETHAIEEAQELDPAWLAGRERVGLTAGASTPDAVIAEVAARLRELAPGS
ncbi:MAG: 4-hydroxy-3-methylbut-2-enyl diphosphate reductase [Chloroflexi bacterium]|nr:4-hydroxy-3-methylbut-2-enyl diphosphate reductase [Chloroflexota bacterium]